MITKQTVALNNTKPHKFGIVARQSYVNPIEPVMVERLIRLPEVMGLTSLKKSTVYLKISLGEFPSPVKIGQRASAWKFTEISDWIKHRVKSSNKVGL